MSISIGNIRGNNNRVGRVHATVIGQDFTGIIVNGQAIGPGADKLKKVAQIQLTFLDEKGQPIGENDSYSYSVDKGFTVEVSAQTIGKTEVDNGTLVVKQAERIDLVKTHTGSVQIEQAGSVGDVSTHTGKVSITGDVTGKVSTHVGSVYVNGKLLPKR